MKAIRFVGKRLSLEEIDIPKNESETLVRVVRSGICNTDLEIIRGYADFEGTIGHEFVGIVEESNERPDLVGKRVVGEINVGCGECEVCKTGDSRHCPRRTVLGIHGRDGAHAEFLTLPAKNLIEVPENVSNEEAVFVEPLAAAYGINEQVEILPETKVAVVGDGKLGLLCAMTLALKSKNVTLIGKHREKLGIAEKNGIEGLLVQEIEGKLNRSFDIVVEASGAESGFLTSLDLIKPRGKMVLKSTFHGKTSLQMWQIVVDEISIIGSRCGRFLPALKLLSQKKINVQDLISEEFPLTKGIEAIEKARQKSVLKVLLRP
ncbi:MAG: alcohol dehydrogenase [Acidobacteria bacterium]|jgi:threonine dehydrogenase-like Zn-dependent dehydrogenase|nr:MAG: alcohol dehydrogenase [Acidobacteriota bacterium]GIU82709.1 MAG: alcohol dehydrogenase [Pyrinomonadaceae bacterium]